MDQPGRIRSLDELLTLYREPSSLVTGKIKPQLDPVSTAFVQHCPFVLIATRGADGRLDVSPRGGPPGFIRVLENGAIAIPDLNGNNLVDSLRGVVETGEVGMIFVMPGQTETLRVNGAAYVSIDPELLGGFTTELKTPKCAIVVEPSQVFIHCAKAFRRGKVWDSDTWESHTEGIPDAIDILSCQLEFPDGGAALREHAEAAYQAELAQD
jgi:uncharacterized protein